MGTPEFAVPSLEILVHNHCQVVAVVTAPDKPRGRGQELSPTPVKQSALRYNLPLLEPNSLREIDFAGKLAAFLPDVIIVVAFRILPKEIYTLARVGAFNLHASLLPKYRGAAPINWAIINGENETGVTTFFLEEKVDTGNILLQEKAPIGPDDDAGVVHDRLSTLGAEVVLRTVRLIEEGKALSRRQEDVLSTPAPKIFKEDCRIDWEKTAETIRNRVRGLSPHPAAFTVHAGRILKIYRTRVSPEVAPTFPGRTTVQAGRLWVGTGDSAIEILEIQQEGRKRMQMEEFLRGYRLASGEQLP